MAALDQPHQLVRHRRGAADVCVVAIEGEHVAAQEQVTSQPALELAQDRVLGAGELAATVLARVSCRRAIAPGRSYPARRSRTIALTRLPSARSPTFGITTPITLPISPGSDAPASAMAASTTPASSWSGISSSR